MPPHLSCSDLAGAISDVIVAPQNPRLVAIGFHGWHLSTSRDGGHSWTGHHLPAALHGVPEAQTGIEFTGDGTLVAPAAGGVATSSDLGATWSSVDLSGSGIAAVSQIVPDPVNHGGLWACAAPNGPGNPNRFDTSVAYSGDDGATWKLVGTVHSGDWSCEGLAVQPGGSVLLAEVESPTSADPSLFRSTDAGVSWHQAGGFHPDGVHAHGSDGAVESLAFDPDRPSVALATGYKNQASGRTMIFRTTNAGETWRTVKAIGPNHRANAVAISTDGIALVETETGFLVSRNHGAAWQTARAPKGNWLFIAFGDAASTLRADGRSFLFYSTQLEDGATQVPGPFWRLNGRHTAFKWAGGWRAAG